MGDYYTIEVSLRGAGPRVWRRFMIRSSARFLDLHEAIQDACGWNNSHLFRFQDEDGRALAGLPDGPDDVTTPDARINSIRATFGSTKGRKILCVYDFGDGCCNVATRKLKDRERLEWLEGWHPDRVDLRETARLFYQAKLVRRGHYE